MENTQNSAAVSMDQVTAEMISIPLQKLFDECMSYISVSDFIMQ